MVSFTQKPNSPAAYVNEKNIGTLSKEIQSRHIQSNLGSVWQQVLAVARSKLSEKPHTHLVVLGSPDVGKSTLLRFLQSYGRVEVLPSIELFTDTGAVSAVDAAFVHVRQLDDADDLTTSDVESICNVWILQHPHHTDMLVQRLVHLKCLSRLAFMVVVDLQQAWLMMVQLQTWITTLMNIVDRLSVGLDPDEIESIRARLRKYISNYKKLSLHEMSSVVMSPSIVPQAADANSTLDRLSTVSFGQQEEESEKASSSLSVNFGIPITVVVTRSDTSVELTGRNSQGHMDIIKCHLRRSCLPLGAAIIFTNVKNTSMPVNTLLLYRYIFHRLYGHPFRDTAELHSDTAFFLPSGWDTEEDIQNAIKATIAGSFNISFETIINKPVSVDAMMTKRTSVSKVEVMESFLGSMLQQYPSMKDTSSKDYASHNSNSSLTFPGPKKTDSVPGIASLASISCRRSTSGGSTISHDGFHRKATVTFGSSTLSEYHKNTQQSHTQVSPSTTTPTRPRSSPDAGPPPFKSPSQIPNQSPSAQQESSSLQNFFQGLLAKGRKGGTTPRERHRPTVIEKTTPPASPTKPPGDTK